MRELAHLGKFIKADLEKAAGSKDAESQEARRHAPGANPCRRQVSRRTPAGLRGRNVQVMNINGQITITIDGKVLDLTPPVLPKPDLHALRTIARRSQSSNTSARRKRGRSSPGSPTARPTPTPTKEAKAALERLEKR